MIFSPFGRVDLEPELSPHEHACSRRAETQVEVLVTNLGLLRSTSCRVVASVLDAAEDLEEDVDPPWVEIETVVEVDVVDVDCYWVVLACITIFSVNFPIVSLLAPKTEREGKIGYPTNRIDLDMANSPR